MPIRRPVSRPLALAVVALAVAAAGCRDSPVGPYTPSGSPPSGLATSLAVVPVYQLEPPAQAVIAADGDSVVAAVRLSVSGCLDYAAQAGMAGGALVVTVVESAPPTPRVCTMIAADATFRTVVRGAPRGSYDAVLRHRLTWPSQGPSEQELARQGVTVR